MRKTIVFVFILALVMGCAASFKEKRTVSKPLVSLAMGKIQQDDIQGALVELKRALDANPGDPEVYYALAMAHWKSQKYQTAVENADKAIAYADNLGLDHPGLKSEAYNLKGTLLVSMGKNEEAVTAFRNAVKDELYATPEYAYYNLASVYFDMKRYEDAMKATQDSLEKNSHYAPAWKILGQIYLVQNEEGQAMSALKHAIDEYPGYTEAHWDLAQILIKRGQTKDAVRSLNEVVRLDGNGTMGSMAQEQLQNLGSYSE